MVGPAPLSPSAVGLQAPPSPDLPLVVGPAPILMSPSAVGLQAPPSPDLPLVVGPAPISMSPSAVGMHAVPAGTLAFHQTFRAASSYQSFWSGCWLSTRPSGKQAATSLSGQVVGFPPDPQGSKQLPVFLVRLLAFHQTLREASSYQSFWPGCWLSTRPSGQQAATSLSGQAAARLLAFHQPLRLRDTSQCSGSLGTSQ